MPQQTNTPKRKLPPSFWRLLKILLFIFPIIGLGSLNVLTLVNNQAHSAGVSFLKTILTPVLAEATLTRLLSHSPTQKYVALEKSHHALNTKLIQLKKVSDTQSKVAREISTRIARRTTQSLVKNTGSFPGKMIPVAGTALMVAMTANDFYDDCQTLKDLTALSATFSDKTIHDNTICGMKFPFFSGK